MQSDEIVSPEGDRLPVEELPVSMSSTTSDQSVSSPATIERVYRHRLPVRIRDWLNVPFLIILIMSGLQVFNAHPALHWGDRSHRSGIAGQYAPLQTRDVLIAVRHTRRIVASYPARSCGEAERFGRSD